MIAAAVPGSGAAFFAASGTGASDFVRTGADFPESA